MLIKSIKTHIIKLNTHSMSNIGAQPLFFLGSWSHGGSPCGFGYSSALSLCYLSPGLMVMAHVSKCSTSTCP
jgi:hypothetical protein